MTHRILRLFFWQFHWTSLRGSDSLVWRKDGYLGITVNEMWGSDLVGNKSDAELSHLGATLLCGKTKSPYNIHRLHANMRAKDFRLRSRAPIAFVSFSWWKGEFR